MSTLLDNIFFVFQRLTWTSVIDILLVTLIFFFILYSLRDTQAMALLRGVIILTILLVLLTSLINLPAFSWLVSNALPAMLVAIPVVFAPELRRTLERIGRAGALPIIKTSDQETKSTEEMLRAVINAAQRLSARQHGALIVLQRNDNLEHYIESGVRLEAQVTPELLLQIFYPNTPLHDGAVIIANHRIAAAACVMPLSTSGILATDRQMGLRHRAALGISEASDAVAIVVSEETGAISITHAGRIWRRLEPERLENMLFTFFQHPKSGQTAGWGWLLWKK
ncbi:MAG: diadenylate cyclase CdaA [Chloroflexi bacterium]|nr:diadenylate cyclase CdaA [Chloroflexota bacterium]